MTNNIKMEYYYILIGLAVLALIIFTFMWRRFSLSQPTDQYSPIVVQERPTVVQERPIVEERPIKIEDSPKVIGKIVPLYSKKRRSKGENMCARSLEEIFDVPFPSERPEWAMGLKGRPLEYDCINHKLKLIVEYEGKQHYEIGHFGMGQEQFDLQNEYDRMKFKYAEDRGYYIIQVPYTVPLEEIKDYIIDYLPANRKRRLDQDATM